MIWKIPKFRQIGLEIYLSIDFVVDCSNILRESFSQDLYKLISKKFFVAQRGKDSTIICCFFIGNFSIFMTVFMIMIIMTFSWMFEMEISMAWFRNGNVYKLIHKIMRNFENEFVLTFLFHNTDFWIKTKKVYLQEFLGYAQDYITLHPKKGKKAGRVTV